MTGGNPSCCNVRCDSLLTPIVQPVIFLQALDVLRGFSLLPLVSQGRLRPLDGDAGSPAGSVPQPQGPVQGVLFSRDPEQEKLRSTFLGHQLWLRVLLAQLMPHTDPVGV